MDKLGVSMVIPPVILPKLKSTTDFPVSKCASFHHVRAMNHNRSVIKQADIPKK